MKKLLFISSITLTVALNAQVLQTENFDALNTATIVGQGTPSYANLGGAGTDYMVVAGGNTGKGLSISGPATAGASRYLWKGGLDTQWAARAAGNNIIQVEYDYYTGAVSTSTNGGGVELYDSTFGVYLGGLSVENDTKVIYGITTTATVPGLTNLGAGTANVILPANTWVRVGFAYNTTNGTVTFKGPGFNKTVTGTDIAVPFELDYAVQDLGTNAAASTHLFDNLVVTAVATESLLATNDVSLQTEGFEVYPNPATDFLIVKSKTKILAAYIYDMSGIRMDAKIIDGKVNVKNLQKGTYVLGLKTEKGLVSKKFIKK